MIPARGLYVITPDWDDTGRLVRITGLLLDGGAVRVQYRHKTASAHLRLAQAQALQALCAAQQVPLLINDDVELALAVGAAGAHLGRDDGELAAARAALGPDRLLGASCYGDIERARAAVAAGADHVAFGAMYPSPTKPHATTVAHALLGQARRELGVAVACIGGITLENAPALIAAGADHLAVISDVYNAVDPRGRAADYSCLFTSLSQDVSHDRP